MYPDIYRPLKPTVLSFIPSFGYTWYIYLSFLPLLKLLLLKRSMNTFVWSWTNFSVFLCLSYLFTTFLTPNLFFLECFPSFLPSLSHPWLPSFLNFLSPSLHPPTTPFFHLFFNRIKLLLYRSSFSFSLLHLFLWMHLSFCSANLFFCLLPPNHFSWHHFPPDFLSPLLPSDLCFSHAFLHPLLKCVSVPSWPPSFHIRSTFYFSPFLPLLRTTFLPSFFPEIRTNTGCFWLKLFPIIHIAKLILRYRGVCCVSWLGGIWGILLECHCDAKHLPPRMYPWLMTFSPKAGGVKMRPN